MTVIATEPDFDRLARVYRWAEYLALGPLLERTREHFLPQLRSCRHALVLGDGDGRFLARLLQQNQSIEALAIDTSAAMLRLLAARCANAGARLRTHHASAMDTVAPPATDLVVTHFFLDCLTQAQVDALTSALAADLNPGTLWVVSDFRIPPSGLLRPPARLYIRALYFAFGLLTGLRVQSLPDPQAALARAGFTCVGRHTRLFGMLYSELWQLQGSGSATMKVRSAQSAAAALHPPAMTISVQIDRPALHHPDDAQPDPEPAAPSLAEPDPGVFHHDFNDPATTEKPNPA